MKITKKRNIFKDKKEVVTPKEELTHIESIVLFHYGYKVSGFTYQAGKFQTTLIEAIILADLSNQRKLKSAFPELVLAVQTNDKLIAKLHRLMSL